ncbi:YebC/PmpR family DNA-binding transcriptional regulator [Candidatus Microgenomates bacterium]|nr:YebC/PmpR family DNA-binding transcriptional regulator [Candidatus Microgenomates bacterium]
MSGHSKWSTIKRQKEGTDAKKSLAFSKFAKAISIAAKSGPDPDSNFKLRLIIERARAINMPKDNIERAIGKASSTSDVEETVYEGFGPGGVSVVVQAATDNKNRTAQEMKNLFERGGGRLASPGSVAYGFEQVGQILVSKNDNPEEQMLALIDAGGEDLEETDDGIEVYVKPTETAAVRAKIEEVGFSVIRMELSMRPKTLVQVSDPETAKKAITFLENLESHEDVQNVYSNLEVGG